MNQNLFLLCVFISSCMAGCADEVKSANHETSVPGTAAQVAKKDTALAVADAQTILARNQVPILCYHHIKDFKGTESARVKDYIVPIANFKEQMKMLHDSGYHTILPDDYFNYLTKGTPLPEKPIMLTFDDTDGEQYTIGAPEMNKYGFKGVFFIMTIAIGKPNYMSREQLKDLADQGHVIGAHTWDHHNVKKYTGDDWEKQFTKPKEQLEAITGKPVTHFAYPFGLWNHEAIPELKKRGYITAYQLSDNKRDSTEPLYSLRRMLVPGTWSTATMRKWMKYYYK